MTTGLKIKYCPYGSKCEHCIDYNKRLKICNLGYKHFNGEIQVKIVRGI